MKIELWQQRQGGKNVDKIFKTFFQSASELTLLILKNNFYLY